MAEIQEQLKRIVKALKGNEGVIEDVAFYSFIISLLPIPGIQQAAQVALRIADDEKMSAQLEALWRNIEKTNERVSNIEDEFSSAMEIAQTVSHNSVLDEECRELIDRIIQNLGTDKTQWQLKTENWSYQEVLRCIVEADEVEISSTDNSTNIIRDSDYKTRKTTLHSSDNSSNRFIGAKFMSPEGGAELNHVTTYGDVKIVPGGMSLNKKIVIGRESIQVVCDHCGQEFSFYKPPYSANCDIDCPFCHRSTRRYVELLPDGNVGVKPWRTP